MQPIDSKKQIDLLEYQKLIMDILIDFDRVCSEKGLKYSLDSGTLLGAVRHKNIIPWDDDIDVIMLRSDYDKFQSIRSELSPQYEFISVDTHKRFSAPLAKIIDKRTSLFEKNHAVELELGAYIDVFVFDYVPQNIFLRYLIFFKAFLARKVWGFSIYPPKTKLKLEKLLREWAEKKQIGRRATMNLEKFARKRKVSSLVCRLMFNSIGFRRSTFPTKLVSEYTKLDFGDCKFKAFKEYDSYLKQSYGDYMTPPPLDRRVPSHNIRVQYK